MDKTAINTHTLMLPDWQIEVQQKVIADTLQIVESTWRENPYECIGRMQFLLKDIQNSFAKAKSTKQETYYEVE